MSTAISSHRLKLIFLALLLGLVGAALYLMSIFAKPHAIPFSRKTAQTQVIDCSKSKIAQATNQKENTAKDCLFIGCGSLF